MSKPDILIVGAGINGLVAANNLQRSGWKVTMVERAERVGGACVSDVATIDGLTQHYALGASVLGLMQDFVFEETGLASRVQAFVPEQIKKTEAQRFRGSSGKLNLMFRQPVRWKHGTDASDSDAAFRFMFLVSSIDEYEDATLRVLDTDVDYAPGYLQIYCEGAAMRQLKYSEPFDRLTVFFKNLSLGENGAALPEVESQVKETLFEYIENPEDCVWSRLLTPKDLQQLFHFPGGNIDYTVLTGGQTYFDRTYSDDPAKDFYRFGSLDNVYLCGAGTYPCGSVAGTPGYMCSQQLLRHARLS